VDFVDAVTRVGGIVMDRGWFDDAAGRNKEAEGEVDEYGTDFSRSKFESALLPCLPPRTFPIADFKLEKFIGFFFELPMLPTVSDARRLR
jgi:hypothetical protein